MPDHLLPATTRTVELRQLAELSQGLDADGAGIITAADLGLDEGPSAGATARRPAPSAVLRRLSWDGPPEFPYVHGHFGGSAADAIAVDLHTASLRELSHRLGFHHRWGF